MKATNDVILRQIAGEYILVPVGAMARKLHGMISLSESGHLLWNCLQKDVSVDELVKALLSEYDTDEQTAREDVSAFLKKLADLGLLIGE